MEVNTLEVALILHQVTDWNDWQTLPVLLGESFLVDIRMLILELLEFLNPAKDLNDFWIALNVPPVIVAVFVNLILIFWAQNGITAFTRITDEPSEQV